MRSSLITVIDASGAASANSQVGYVSVLDFAGWVYVASTMGIFSTEFADPTNATFNASNLVTYNTRPLPRIGSDFNISMNQERLTITASVSTTR
ncbi:hypothetical protein B0H19DRAFT_1240307 [Mycena capillaripes]|nr:hypothetical protein B0H19DRAFT_1240307 [Mycena capillaripes]